MEGVEDVVHDWCQFGHHSPFHHLQESQEDIILKLAHQSQLCKKHKVMKGKTDLKSSNHQERIETTMGVNLIQVNIRSWY